MNFLDRSLGTLPEDKRPNKIVFVRKFLDKIVAIGNGYFGTFHKTKWPKI
jgi:hypothetical protein